MKCRTVLAAATLLLPIAAQADPALPDANYLPDNPTALQCVHYVNTIMNMHWTATFITNALLRGPCSSELLEAARDEQLRTH